MMSYDDIAKPVNSDSGEFRKSSRGGRVHHLKGAPPGVFQEGASRGES